MSAFNSSKKYSSTNSSTSSNSSTAKKAPNKLYTKEINSLIEKIIKSKKNTFRLTQLHAFNQHVYNNNNNINSNNNLNSNSEKLTKQNYSLNKENNDIKSLKISKHYHTKSKTNQSKSDTSSINEPQSISIISNNIGNSSNSKVSEFTKLLEEFIEMHNSNKKLSPSDKVRRSGLFIEILKFLKQEKDLSNIIFDNEQFVNNILEIVSIVNFAHIRAYPKYKVTDSNYNIIEANLSKQIIEEFAVNENDNNNGNVPSMIRIKNECWQDILNLYDIFIVLLNNIPTESLLISKIPLKFISDLVLALQTLDNEERIIIKLIIYKIYISSLTYRKFILKNISNILIDITRDENSNLLCLGECLDLLKCIILGAKKPIHEKYMSLIKDIICPLLKCKNIYKQNILKEMIYKLMAFDKNVLQEILNYLIKTWPVRYPDRIITYLDILENIFTNNLTSNLDENLLNKIFRKIKICFSDLSFLIADRSLIFFKNENFIVELYKSNLQLSFLSKLVENIENHWSQEIKIISRIVISRLSKRDEKLLNNLSETEKKIIDDFKFDINESEDIWDIQFNLKGD
jgi:hypothetical protein